MKRHVREQIETYGSPDAVIQAAMELLRSRLAKGAKLADPSAVRQFLTLNLSAKQYEVFWVVFLDTQNRVIAAEEMFRGTLSQTSVYPREVAKRCFEHNAGNVIFAHNHPSGLAEPSAADEYLTRALKQALALIDVKVLDHFVIAGGDATSFAERGLL